MSLNKSEKLRYSRQIILKEIGEQGQQRIKDASVLVIGAGGLGCPVLLYLTAAGIGTIGILDNDCVEESNLQRQVLYSVTDIDKPKPEAAIEKLSALNPNIHFQKHFFRLSKENALTTLANYNIIVDCTDNFSTRYLISDACVILGKPLVYGAVFQFEGQISVLNYKNGPTLRCLQPDIPHPLEIPGCSEAGIIGYIAGIVGAMQANETVKIILGTGDILRGRMFTINALTMETQIVSFERNPEASAIKELGEYDEYCFPKNEAVNEISVDELLDLMKINPDIQLIDLRDADETIDMMEGFINIPYHEIPSKTGLIHGAKNVVFYCTYGIKSKKLINFLKYKNFTNTFYSLTTLKS